MPGETLRKRPLQGDIRLTLAKHVNGRIVSLWLKLLYNRLRHPPFVSWEGRMMSARIPIDRERIAEFCRRNHIRKLSLFGSVLGDDFRPDSDVDVLAEFEPGAVVGLIRLAGMEIELSEMLGRKVDLNTAGFLSRHFRDRVLAEAEVQYDAA